uniref:Ribosome biogenesis protein BRX1 homolog n=1 Tax=Meloidogyne javanica TaxID=6303 RepID=A0A915M2M4_MELJA
MSDNEIDQNENLMSVDSSDEDSNDSEDEESSMKDQKDQVGNLKINKKWTDRERVLLLCSRGSVARTRHLINDLKRLMPHIRSEAKYGKSKSMADDLNEMSELANCTKCLYFESRKGRDVYLWMSHIDGGPSAKFLVRNLHSMNELNMIGNCLKGSRPILSFDPKEVKLDDPIGEIFNTKSEDNKNNDDDENMEEEVEKEEKKKKIKIKNNQELNAAKTLRRKILKGRIRKKKAKKTIKK